MDDDLFRHRWPAEFDDDLDESNLIAKLTLPIIGVILFIVVAAASLACLK